MPVKALGRVSISDSYYLLRPPVGLAEETDGIGVNMIPVPIHTSHVETEPMEVPSY